MTATAGRHRETRRRRCGQTGREQGRVGMGMQWEPEGARAGLNQIRASSCVSSGLTDGRRGKSWGADQRDVGEWWPGKPGAGAVPLGARGVFRNEWRESSALLSAPEQGGGEEDSRGCF